MALDTLVLGGFVFTDFAVPDQMPFGGRQHTVVHKMPGGARVIDCMGPDDADRTWSGILWGAGALGQMLSLDALRRAGTELPFSWGAEGRTAVISDCHFEVKKFQCVHYTITVILTDGGTGGALGLAEEMILADLGAALTF